MSTEQKITRSDIWNYIVGSYRNLIYDSSFSFLMRKHISEQITYRISVMDRDCYNNGTCKRCGCAVPAMQMAKKPCLGECYPKLMNKKEWIQYKNLKNIEVY